MYKSSSFYVRSLALICGGFLYFLVFSGCHKPQPVGWDGLYCYRWKEEFNDGEKEIEYLNTCSGEHEELRINSNAQTVTIDGPEGARTYHLISSSEGEAETERVDCQGRIVDMQYRIYKVGRNVLFETAWNDGKEHLRRTSYTILD